MRRFAFLITSFIAVFLLFNAVSSATAVNAEYNINAGGAGFTAGDGTVYVADKAYVAGDFGYTAGRNFRFNSAIANTTDDGLYQMIRGSSAFSYLFDIPNGDYDITLHFMEPWQSAAGERLFDVTIEGVLSLDDYDIYAVSGGQFTAVSESFSATVSDGQLNIDFTGVNRVAMVAAIQVEEAGGSTPEPEITVSPLSLDFGLVENGTTGDITVNIANDGSADLNVSSLSTDNGVFTVESPTAPIVIAAGNNTDVTIRFSPVADGAQSGNLTIASDDTDESSVVVSLDGEGFTPAPDEPEITVSPTSLNFGSVENGTTSDLTVNIANDGTADLNVSSLTTDNGVFTVESPSAPVVIGAGNNTDFTIRFSPVADGAQSGNLTIASDDADESSVVVSLDGEGFTPAPDEPEITVSPTSLDFGSINTGSTADLTVNIANDGTADLNVSSLTTDNSVFTVESPTAPIVIGAGNNTDVTIRYAPAADGADSGSLTIASDDADESSVVVSLSGSSSTPVAGESYHINSGGADYTSVSGDLFVADKAYTVGDFGYNGNGRTFSFTSAIANTDDDTLYQTVRGAFALEYLFDLDNGEYDVTLYFMEPFQSAAGERAFDVEIEGNQVLDNYDIYAEAGGIFTAVTETFTVDITDGQLDIDFVRVNRTPLLAGISVESTTATAPEQDIAVSPASLNFGDVETGMSSDLIVTISNDGTLDLEVTGIASSNGIFTASSASTPFTLAPGGSQDVTVTFSPTALGAENGSLDITSDDPDEGTVSISLDGNGVDAPPDEPDISLSSTTLAFGSVNVGNSSTETLTVSNNGTQTLTVSSITSSNGDYAVTAPAIPFDVTASGSVNVTVEFTPAATGASNGDLTVNSNDPDEASLIVSMTGSGTAISGNPFANVTTQVDISANHVVHPSICPAPPIGSGSAWGDYDNDGDPDVYMTNHGGANYLYRNDGDTDSDGMPNFTDVAGSLGIQNSADLSTGVTFIDYDNDGDQDLYVLNWEGNDLYENQLIETGSVSFTNVTSTAGIGDAGRAITAAWADFNNDGFLDVYLAKHRKCAGDEARVDALYQSNGDGTFTNVTSYLCEGSATCSQVDSLGFMSGWFDYDNDGDQDMYLINDNIGGNYHPNVLWRNDGADGSGSWTFTDVSVATGLDVSLNGMGLAVGDYDNDGHFDVAFSNISPARLMHNQGDGTYADVSDRSGVQAATPQGTWGTAFFDYNNDMFVDLFIVAGGIGSQTVDHPDVLLENDGDGENFTDISDSSGIDDDGWGRSASMNDFDQDGWVDMIIGNYLDGYYLYRNQSADNGNTSNWIAITVEGTESNRDGIGTRLTLTANGEIQMREINSGSTHGGGDQRVAFFGLDNGDSGTLVIDWPNGESETINLTSGDMNQYRHEVEPSSAPPPATTFVEVTADVGFTVPHVTSSTICSGPPLGTGSAWADYDNDGDIDAFIVSSDSANWLYRNDGDTNSNGLPNFTDVAASAGVDNPNGVGHSAVFIDYDNDGDQDLYVTNWDDGTAPHGNILFENQLVESGSATFTDVTATAGLADDGRGITSGWGDYDNDGYLDVYIAKHTACGSDPAEFLQDHLYKNNGDGTFTDVSNLLCTSTGGVLPCPTDIEGRGFAPAWFDYDGDGDLDLHVVNDINDATNPNRMWRNDGAGCGGWCFTNVSTASGTELAINSMGLGIGDSDNDGDLDIAVSDVGSAHLLVNNDDGTFTEALAGLPAGVTWGTVFLDYDNDGWQDLFLASGSIHDPNNNPPDAMMRNRGGDGFPNTFVDVSTTTGLDHDGRGRHVARVDFDQDGWVDIIVGNYGEDYRLYRNMGFAEGNTNNWLTITVEGTDSNRDGIGTKLFVTYNGMTQMYQINSGPSHGGGDFKAGYFGLGSSSTASLEIHWPNGEVQNIGTVNSNQALHYVEPLSNPPATDFVNVTAVAGLSGTHDLGLVCEPPIGSGSAWGDYDNDGDVDLYITNRGGNNWLYRNDGDTNSDGVTNFTEVAVALGIEMTSGASLAATFIDYDNDGDQDLFVSNWENDNTEGTYPGSALFENQLIESGSVSFVELANTGLDVVEGRVITAAWADINEDGLLDVFLTKHKECSANEGDNNDQLFTNNGDGTFTDVTSWLCGGASTCTAIDDGLGFSPGFVDYDNDGDLDLYLVNDIIGGDWHPNTLWRNDGAGCGGWCFTDVSVSSGADAALNGMGLAMGDYDNDGWFDFAFSNIGPVGVLHNNGDGTFTDASASSGVASNTTGATWATVFFDHNNDGWLDLYAAAGGLHDDAAAASYFLQNDGTGVFTNYNIQSGLNDDGRARSVSIADFNGDGWMDVFVGNYGEPFVLYMNGNTDQGNSNHYLSFTVEGTESNRDGIGTRIIVTANGVTQMREINSGPTHGGGDQRIALFGLGSETSATVTVQWPNGEVENLGVVTADQQMHLVEPASTP